VITRLVKEVDAPISIDTYKPKVAEECLKLGVKIVNDISGFRNQEMIKVAAKYNAKVIIMHMLGEPKTMQADPKYDNVIEDIKTFFKKRIKAVTEAGIKDVVLDPGIGFGKTLEHNLTILKNLEQFEELGYPLLVGASRKTFLGMITGLPVEERLESSLAAHVIAVMNGCSIIRTHDVKETRRAMMVVEAIRKT
ncbi:dihydropteroate synthase, partial [Candidatus Woesearchaeota archaeon CG10_big_fil_rev_8_21_14_0_10_45_16]